MRYKENLSDRQIAQTEALARLSEMKLRMAQKSLEAIAQAEEKELCHLRMATALLTLKDELGVTWKGLQATLQTSASVDTLKSVALRRRSLAWATFKDLCEKVNACEIKHEIRVSLVKVWENK